MMLGLEKLSRPLLAMSAGILTCVIALSPASATEGYFQNGYGARQKALAGAGAADSRDATAAALNPAGLVHVGTEASIAASLFSPRREVESPAFFGTVESGSDYFIVRSVAVAGLAVGGRRILPHLDKISTSIPVSSPSGAASISRRACKPASPSISPRA